MKQLAISTRSEEDVYKLCILCNTTLTAWSSKTELYCLTTTQERAPFALEPIAARPPTYLAYPRLVLVGAASRPSSWWRCLTVAAKGILPHLHGGILVALPGWLANNVRATGNQHMPINTINRLINGSNFPIT